VSEATIYEADKRMANPKRGFVISIHLPYVTVNFLRIEIEKVLFSLDRLSKTHASGGCPVQTPPIPCCSP